jgi:hypothetical protein
MSASLQSVVVLMSASLQSAVVLMSALLQSAVVVILISTEVLLLSNAFLNL